MGTLEQSDLVGLNLTLDIHKVILADLDCSKAPQHLLVDLVAAGKTGAYAGEGFRKYSPEERAELDGLRRAGDGPLLGDGHEISKMTQFHSRR